MIGIVGGMGPFAGLDVFRKIIEETLAVGDQGHASVLLFSLPSAVPDRTRFLLGEERTNPGYAISDILLKLEIAGATVAGIPCNTAHAPEIFDVIEDQLRKRGSQLELLHIIKIAVAHISENFQGRRIGMLSTTGTWRTKLYKKALEVAGNEVIEPDEKWQEKIHKATYDEEYGIKAHSSPVYERTFSELQSAMDHLLEKGAEVVVLGCTELPLAITGAEHKGLPIIDPNLLLARALISGNRTGSWQKIQQQHI